MFDDSHWELDIACPCILAISFVWDVKFVHQDLNRSCIPPFFSDLVLMDFKKISEGLFLYCLIQNVVSELISPNSL